jgi:hypothetical protein
MRYDASSNLTSYIISHKVGDTSIKALRNILDIAVDTAATIFLRDPFDNAVILSTVSLEASKHHVSDYSDIYGHRSVVLCTGRILTLAKLNKVDDYLEGLETNDRRELSGLTKELQVVSQNADSHLANADVAIITAEGIRRAHDRLHKLLPSPASVHERGTDSITYVIESMQKAKDMVPEL